MFEPTAATSDDHRQVRLLERIASRRDRDAFAGLYDIFAARIRSYLLSRGADSALADEVLQASLLQVWEKAALYNPASGTVAGWVYRIARNRFVDHLRRQKIRDRPAPVYWQTAETQAAAGNDTEQDSVRRALKQLPNRQAQVIYMSFYQGKTQREIAAELEMPLGSVKSSLRLGFEKLRASLGEFR